MSTKKLEELFNVDPFVPPKEESLVPEVMSQEISSNTISHKLENSNDIKTTLDNILTDAKTVLTTISTETNTNPNPKNVEAVAKLVDAISKIVGQQIELSGREKDNEIKLLDSNKPNPTALPIQNNTLILTTSELLSKILEKKQLG